MVYHPENQSNSYDNENASWSNVPDLDFVMDDDKEWMIGQFVWTGSDYLGHTTRMPGHRIVPYLAYSTWRVFPKTDSTCIGACGTRKTIHCTSFHIGT